MTIKKKSKKEGNKNFLYQEEKAQISAFHNFFYGRKSFGNFEKYFFEKTFPKKNIVFQKKRKMFFFQKTKVRIYWGKKVLKKNNFFGKI